MNPLSSTISQEQNTDTQCLADLPLPEMLVLLNEHDARVPLAIKAVQAQVEEAVRLIVTQIKSGGRLFIKLGRVHNNLMIDVKASNEKLYRRAEHMAAHLCGVEEAAAQMLLEQAGYNVRAAVLGCMLSLAPDTALTLAAQPFVTLKLQLLSGAANGQ